MMYFSWNPGTVVDEENRPVVAGRVSVFVHDSNVLASVYTMEGDQYVPAQNPQFLDGYGRLQATLFAELGVYDVKIERRPGTRTRTSTTSRSASTRSSTRSAATPCRASRSSWTWTRRFPAVS